MRTGNSAKRYIVANHYPSNKKEVVRSAVMKEIHRKGEKRKNNPTGSIGTGY